jgi:hypothetical protein
MIKPVLRIQLGGRGRSKHQSLCVLTNLDLGAGSNIPEPQYCFKLSVPDPGIFVRIRLRDLSFFLLLYYREWKDSINPQLLALKKKEEKNHQTSYLCARPYQSSRQHGRTQINPPKQLWACPKIPLHLT